MKAGVPRNDRSDEGVGRNKTEAGCGAVGDLLSVRGNHCIYDSLGTSQRHDQSPEGRRHCTASVLSSDVVGKQAREQPLTFDWRRSFQNLERNLVSTIRIRASADLLEPECSVREIISECRPAGACVRSFAYPALPHWATLCRASGAGVTSCHPGRMPNESSPDG
jgi:hypothetical protein